MEKCIHILQKVSYHIVKKKEIFNKIKVYEILLTNYSFNFK